MVQVLESNPSFSQQLGRKLGEAGGNIASQLAENSALKKRGIDLRGISDPTTRAMVIAEGLRRGTAIQEGEASIPPEFRQSGKQTQVNQQPFTSPPPQQSQAVTPQSNAPQTAPPQASGQTRFLSPAEMKKEAANRYYANKQRGIVSSFQQELSNLQQEQNLTEAYEQRQQGAGSKGEEHIRTAFGRETADPDQVALFKRKGEELARLGVDQSTIDKRLAQEARKYKDQLDTLRDVQGMRIFRKTGQFLTGTGREPEKVKESIRIATKPFLDRGEYDLVREELSDKGYGPEEVEDIISGLGEGAKKNLASFENVEPSRISRAVKNYPGVEDPSYRAFSGNPEGQEAFGEHLKKTLQDDPSANLILLRKAYEDKGVDWDSFVTEYNKLLSSDQIQQTEEQRKMTDYLKEPPLNRLQRLLYEMNWRGR